MSPRFISFFFHNAQFHRFFFVKFQNKTVGPFFLETVIKSVEKAIITYSGLFTSNITVVASTTQNWRNT